MSGQSVSTLPRYAVYAAVSALIVLQPAAAQEPAAPRVTTRAVRDALGAGRADAITVRATVTRPYLSGDPAFVQDADGGLVVLPSRTAPATLVTGEMVDIVGVPSFSPRGPALLPQSITLIGRTTPPTPQPLDWAAVRSGAADALLVEASGVVRARRDAGVLALMTIGTGGGALLLEVAGGALDANVRPGSLLTARGVLAPVSQEAAPSDPSDAESRVSHELLVESGADVRVLEAAPADLFTLPVTSAASLRAVASPATRPVHVDGVVTYHQPGGALYVRDASGDILVETEAAAPLAIGDRVDVVGFPVWGAFAPYLAHAVHRHVASGSAPQARPVSAADLRSGRHDAQLIAAEARVIVAERGRDELSFVLQDGDQIFHARMPANRSTDLQDRINPGDRIRVVGVCAVIADASRQPRAFQVLSRDASDVTLLERASPGWTIGSTSAGVIALAVALASLAGLGVVYRRARALERTIRRQMAREASLKARFDDLFERASDIIIVHDRRGRVSTINRTGEQLSGYPREEVRTIDASWLFSQSYLDVVQRMIGEGPDAVPRVIRAELITRKSARIPIEAQARVLVGDGQVTGVTVVARNMQERDQLESQLRQAQKMEAVGRLATGIAHDFNNLITVLMGYSDELAERVERDSALRKPVEEVRRAVLRASGLTQQLLAFSRRQTSQTQTVDLNATVAPMKDLLRRLLGAEIRLDVNLAPNLGMIDADPVQVGQIVMNLAVNARDAMQHGGTLTIETANVELGAEHLDVIPGAHVMLLVRDTGTGMTQEVQRRLFEPFFTTKETGQGTGLGLSMVYAIVREAKGHIDVTSDPGHGSTFRIYFPRLPDAVEAPAQAAASRSQTGTVTGSGVVLLAEDDRAVRRLMSAELRRRGFNVLEARHGGEALEMCRQYGGNIDVLVTDVVMPTMNGADLAAAAAPIRPEMKVLFISGHPERAGAGLDPGGPDGAHLLLKPFTPETLAARINDILAARGPR